MTAVLAYEELRVRVRRVGTGRYLVTANGPAAAAEVIAVTGEPAAFREQWDRLIAAELGLAPMGAQHTVEQLRVLGRGVFRLLFGGNEDGDRDGGGAGDGDGGGGRAVGRGSVGVVHGDADGAFGEGVGGRVDVCVDTALDRAQRMRPPRGLRVRFDLPPELRDLPLESLCTPPGSPQQALALNHGYSLVRSLPGGPLGRRLPDPADQPSVIRLVVAWASPAGLPPLRATAEVAALKEGLSEVAVQTKVVERATRARLEAALGAHTDLPTAVLLIAHGEYDHELGEGVVSLEADGGVGGGVDRVPADVLSGLLLKAQGLRLVALNLCAGADSSSMEPFSGLAQALIGGGVPAVVAMRGRVSDVVAGTFGPELFKGVAANRTIDESMAAARLRISHQPEHTAVEWATPALFLHEECRQGWLFKAREVRDEDAAATDPLREGAEALRTFKSPVGHVDSTVLIGAARFQRDLGYWTQVRRTLRTPTRSYEDEQRWMRAEAAFELAWPEVQKLCALLAAERDAAGAAAQLEVVREALPGPLPGCLAAEVEALARVTALVDEAAAAEARADWTTAIGRYEEVLALRPEGPRDVVARRASARDELAVAHAFEAAERAREAGALAEAAAAYAAVLALRPGHEAATACATYVGGRTAEEAEDWRAADAAYGACAGFGDAAARAAYVRGRAAAARGDWAKARDAFGGAGSTCPESPSWHAYCTGRAAEAAGAWAAATAGFAAAGGFRDSDVRLRYARGRNAADHGDWPTALTDLAAAAERGCEAEPWLSDLRHRVYEAAVTAAESADWPTALAHLDALPSDYRATRARRRYAEGQLAAASGEWAAAAEAFGECGGRGGRGAAGEEGATGAGGAGAAGAFSDRAEAAGACSDRAEAARPGDQVPDDAWSLCGYARGRVCQEEGRWEGAMEWFVALPSELLDVPDRVLYARGRAADARDEWNGVIDGFGRLPDAYADGEVGARRLYARARVAADLRGDWVTVLSLLTDVPDAAREGTVAALRRKAEGRRAEERGDWGGACAIYGQAFGEGGAPVGSTESVRVAGAVGGASVHLDGAVGGEPAHLDEAVGGEPAPPDGAVHSEPTHPDEAVGAKPAHPDEAVHSKPAHLDEAVHSKPAHLDEAVSGKPAHPNEAAHSEPAHPDGCQDTGSVRRLGEDHPTGPAPGSNGWSSTGSARSGCGQRGAEPPRSGNVQHGAEPARSSGARPARGGGATRNDAEHAHLGDGRRHAPPDDPEPAHLYHYALARTHELACRWRDALDVYRGLDRGWADVVVRQRYVEVRVGEEGAVGAEEWREVIRGYEELVPEGVDGVDVAARGRYARVRLAEAAGDWANVVAEADALGEHPETVAYARGRLADAHQEWQRAADAFRKCAGHRDADAHLAYAEGRLLETAGRWSTAVDAYERAGGALERADVRCRRLRRLIGLLPWADGLTGTPLVADPFAVEDPTFPYLALRDAGVDPGASMDVVKNASYALLERGSMSWDERVALERLRLPGRRLRLDALLYRWHSPDALRDALAALSPDDEGPGLLDALCERFPRDAPLLLLLARDRETAATEWERRLRAAPGDMTVVHGLAAARLWQAQELEQSGAWEHAVAAWESALAYWSTLLSDDEYWDGWRAERAACYERDLTHDDMASLRWELSQHLFGRLSAYEQRHTEQDRPQQAAAYQVLTAVLEAELGGARVLKDVGGLPDVPGAGGTLACGPRYLRLLALEAPLAELAAGLDAAAKDGKDPGEYAVRELRWAFSELAQGFVLSEVRKFEPALRALPVLRTLTTLPEDCAGPAAEPGHTESCPHCADFLRRNPAYVRLPRRHARLLQDGVELAVHIRLALAKAALTRGDGGLGEALDQWTELVRVSRNAGMQARSKKAVIRTVLGRVEALADEDGAQLGPCLDEAVTLVESATRVLHPIDRDLLVQLHAKLSALLSLRGVWRGYTRTKHGMRSDVYGAEADLRRALALNPESSHARDNLARALVFTLDDRTHEAPARLRLLHEALGLLDVGLGQALTHRYRETLGEALDEVEKLLTRHLGVKGMGDLIRSDGQETPPDDDDLPSWAAELTDKAQGALGRGDILWALHHLIRATRADPTDSRIRQALLDAVHRWLGELDKAGGGIA